MSFNQKVSTRLNLDLLKEEQKFLLSQKPQIKLEYYAQVSKYGYETTVKGVNG